MDISGSTSSDYITKLGRIRAHLIERFLARLAADALRRRISHETTGNGAL